MLLVAWRLLFAAGPRRDNFPAARRPPEASRWTNGPRCVTSPSSASLPLCSRSAQAAIPVRARLSMSTPSRRSASLTICSQSPLSMIVASLVSPLAVVRSQARLRRDTAQGMMALLLATPKTTTMPISEGGSGSGTGVEGARLRDLLPSPCHSCGSRRRPFLYFCRGDRHCGRIKTSCRRGYGVPT